MSCTFKDILPECVVTLTFKYIADLLNFRELFTINGRKHEALVLLDLKKIREKAETDINLFFLSVTLCEGRSEPQS